MDSRLKSQESDPARREIAQGANVTANPVTPDARFPSRRAKWEPIVRSVEWPADSWQSAQGLEAVILAGGQGTRLRTLVDDRPKPMAEVAGRPFIEWLFLALQKQGVKRLVLSTGHLADPLERYCGDGSRWGLDIQMSRETSPLGTAGAVRQALQHIHGRRFFVLNGDSFCAASLVKLFVEH